jgi:hypothetical protein
MFARWTIAVLVVGSSLGCRNDTKHPAQNVPTVSDSRKTLLDHIARLGDVNSPATPHPLVTLEEFFEGNNDFGSIGYNFHPDQPSPQEFYQLFKKIRSNPNVADVRVQVTQHDDPEAWPVTDTVWIITSESRESVARWLGKRFAADEILDGFQPNRRYESLLIPEGMKAVGVWWD